MLAPLQPKAEMTPRRPVPPLVHDVIASPGRPLDRSVRSFMEPRFGADFGSVPVRGATGARSSATPDVGAPGDRFEREADAVAGRVTGMLSVAPEGDRVDFSGVRVHADDRAAESARALGADAYTLGSHIVFGAGEYAPGSPTGRELLAHELSHVVQLSAGRPRIQGRWRLDRTMVDNRRETAYDDENGDTMSFGAGGGGAGAVFGRARTWQETGWVHQKVGGSASVAHWLRTRYVFKNEPPFGDYLQLRPEGSIAGRAKAEDLYFGRASSVVWGRIIERTHENPNPGDRELFPPLKDGGVSAATIGDLAKVEADVSLGEHGGVNVQIPLKRVNQGVPSPYDGAISPIHEVRGNFDEVHVVLGARVTADADIRTAIMSWDVAPWVSRNWNIGSGSASYGMRWDSIAPPPARPAAPTAPTVQGGGGAGAGGARARPDLFRRGNAGGPRIDHVRYPPADPYDIDRDAQGNVDGPGQGGVSSFETPRQEKNWWRYPAAKPDPSGIVIRNDHNRHWAWEPARRMHYTEYERRLRASNPDWIKV